MGLLVRDMNWPGLGPDSDVMGDDDILVNSRNTFSDASLMNTPSYTKIDTGG